MDAPRQPAAAAHGLKGPITTLISRTALALAALVATAAVASAENTFVFNRDNDAPGVVNLRGVEAEQAGSIDVFGVADGGPLTFLASTPIAAGQTADAAVNVPTAQQDRLTIHMMNGNRNVATLNVRALDGALPKAPNAATGPTPRGAARCHASRDAHAQPRCGAGPPAPDRPGIDRGGTPGGPP